MPYVLGIDIGSTHVSAAVSRTSGYGWSPPEPAWLDAASPNVAAVLHVSPNGSFALGESPSLLDGNLVARDFVRRVGDHVPLMIAGEAFTPQTLTAVMTMWVVERVAEWEGGYPDQILVSHPGHWGSYRKDVLLKALWDTGLRDVGLLPEPAAVTESHASRYFVGQAVGIYSLSGNSFATSVVRRARPAGFEVAACFEGLEPFGSEDFDAVPDEEAMPFVKHTVQGLLQTARSTGLKPEQLDSVLLVGHAARLPLIAQLMTAELPTTVAVEVDPEVTAAEGAALAARRILAPPGGAEPGAVEPDVESPLLPEAASDDYPRHDYDYDDQIFDLPPRPPVRITKLKLSRRRTSAHL